MKLAQSKIERRWRRTVGCVSLVLAMLGIVPFARAATTVKFYSATSYIDTRVPPIRSYSTAGRLNTMPRGAVVIIR